MKRKEAIQEINLALEEIHGRPLLGMLTSEHDYLVSGVKVGAMTASKAAETILAEYTKACTKLFEAR